MATIKAPCGGIQLDGTKFKIVGDVITSVASVATTFTTTIVCGGIKFDAAYFKNVKNVLTMKDSVETTIDDVIIGACGGIAIDGAYFTITNGVMAFDAEPDLKTLTVASELGTEIGDTIITITEPITAGNHYVYRATVIPLLDPTYDEDLSEWIAWNGTDELTLTNDYTLVIAEANTNGDCRGVGSTLVVSTDIIEVFTVTSEEGASSGFTKITLDKPLTIGRAYVYKTGVTVAYPLYGADLSSWTTWDGAAELIATTGNEIAIAEIFGDFCRATGKAVVVSLE
jgi:hypothetical protein